MSALIPSILRAHSSNETSRLVKGVDRTGLVAGQTFRYASGEGLPTVHPTEGRQLARKIKLAISEFGFQALVRIADRSKAVEVQHDPRFVTTDRQR